MSNTKFLGKISSIKFGRDLGYQDVMFGLSVCFEFDGSGVCDFIGMWQDRSESAKWTEEDQIREFGRAAAKLNELFAATGKKKVEDLVGTPVEVILDSPYGKLESWRVLTEVL